jgi:PAS domain S-box-containing protein
MKNKISNKDLFSYSLNLEEQVKQLEQTCKQLGLLEETIGLFSENSSISYFVFTSKGDIVDINHTMSKLLSLLQKNQGQTIPSQIFNTLFNGLTKDQPWVNQEKQLTDIQGQTISVLLSAKIVAADNDEYIVGYAINVSSDKKVKDSLDLSRANINFLIENVENPAWTIDNKGLLTAFNSAFRDYLYTRYKIRPELDTDIFSALPQDEKLFWQELINDVLKGQKLKKLITFTKNNAVQHYDVVLNPIFNETFKIIGVSGIFHDITDIQNAHSILLKSKSHLNALINNIPYLVWLKDNKGNYIIANQSFLDFWKINSEDIIGKNDKELIKINKDLSVICDDRAASLIGKHNSIEKIITVNGYTQWFEIHTAPIFDEMRMVIGTTGMARDISERKRIENILLESEEKFRQFSENTSDSFILRSITETLYVNPAFENIYGRPIYEAFNFRYTPLEWIHPEDRDCIALVYKTDKFKSTGAFNNEYRIIRPDNSITWVWERSFPIYDEKGKIIRVISVATDFTKQKMLEQDLYKIQTQQQAILDNIPHLAWLKDKQGKYISVNEAFTKFYNLDIDDVIQKTDFDICPPELAELYSFNDEKVINERKQQLFEDVTDTPEGEIYSETIKTPIFNQDNELIGLTGISRDITQHKRLEQQLRRNDERLRALLKNSSDALTVIDKHGLIIFESSHMSYITGFPVDELKNKPFIQLISSTSQYAFLKAIEDVINNPEIQQTVEFQIERKDRSSVYIESIISNHLDNSLINGLVVNSRDITERKLADIKEKQYQENLIFLQNTALDFLSISSSEEIANYIGNKVHELVKESVVIYNSFDEGGNFMLIRSITGIDKFLNIVMEFLGCSPMQFKTSITPDMKREMLYSSNKLRELQGGLYKISNNQIPLLACKALERLVSLNKIYGMGVSKSGKLLGSILILTRYEYDIPDKRIIETFVYQASIALQRRKIEKELIVAKEKAEESDRLKSAFLANMSHEIRTPINGILGFSQLLSDNDLSAERRTDFIDIIKSNAEALITLVDGILDISIIEEGQVKLREQMVNINALLEDIYSTFKQPKFLPEHKNLKFELKKGLPDEDSIIYTDSLRVRQILNNLIGNSFKFTEKGKIEVGYKKDKEKLLFYVKDTGIGISKEKLDAVFIRFIQGDISHTRKYGGSGLGLAISKGLVEILGGNIWIESEVGSGSAFYFTLPIDREAQQNTNTIPQADEKKQSNMHNANSKVLGN